MARVFGVLALVAATASPLALTPTAAASLGGPASSGAETPADPPWSHAFGWGYNVDGQLGNGTTARFRSPVIVSGVVSGFRHVSAGLEHSLAVAADGTVFAWGVNQYGQIGTDPEVESPGLTHPPDPRPSSPVPVRVPGLSDVTQVAAGFFHSLALTADGTVWAWGRNDRGQLGDGTRSSRHGPARVPGVGGVVAIAGGWGHSLALRSDGTVWAWGYNEHGQLGDGTRIDRLTPIVVPGLTNARAVAAGSIHSLAVRAHFSGLPVLNTVWAWGSNDYGQAGDGTQVDRERPVQVHGVFAVTAIAAGKLHSLAIGQESRVWAWGANYLGSLGDGTRQHRLSAVPVVGLTGVSGITAGDYHSVARRNDGTVWAWGNNLSGQLGDGTVVDRDTPVPVPGLGGVTEVSGGGHFTLAVVAVPAPRFTVSVDPVAGTVTAGGTTSFTVSTAPVNGSTHTIALDVSGLPAGVTATVVPSTVVAGELATVAVSSTEVAAVGAVTVTVTGQASPATSYPTTVSAGYGLTVAAGCGGSSDVDVAIADGGPAAVGPLVVGGCADPDLTGSTVEVHIVHPRRGDLVLDLIDPDGRSIRLKNSNPADTRPNMNARFPVRVDPDLTDRLDNSQWRLRIEDVATGAVGHLDAWSLYL
jgi:alpha-tubulin suppressor-like RCC1 family protein